jgi:DNA-binding NarL/FixJ family response regulator
MVVGSPSPPPSIELHDARGQQPPEGKGGCMSRTVLIVDDSSLIRHTFRSFIEQTQDWQVCGEAENGAIAIEKVIELHPDVVILDLQMPVMGGLESARQIKQLAPTTAMVMFTMHDSQQIREEAQAAGIKGFYSKSEDVAKHLFDSLTRLHVERGNRPRVQGD